MNIQITVEDERVLRALNSVDGAIERAVTLASGVVAEEAAKYGGAEASKLGVPWESHIEGATAKIEAPEWWAHFLAHGTRAHGPRSAPFLVFEADGDMVFAGFVQGVPATHFDEKAVEASRGRVEEVIRRAIEAA